MAKGAILGGALLLCFSSAWAQTGSVRVRVTDSSGKPIPSATVTLFDKWNRKISSASATSSGEVVWPRLTLGEWHFMVLARGFAADVFALNVCEKREQLIRAKLPTAPPEQDLERVTVQAEATLLKLEPMPYCNVLDLPRASERK